MRCEKCGQESKDESEYRGAVLDGTYYSRACLGCIRSGGVVSSGHAKWSRSIDVEDHAADILQPWGADGKPNVGFIKLYPKQAAAVFSQEEMDKAMRS